MSRLLGLKDKGFSMTEFAESIATARQEAKHDTDVDHVSYGQLVKKFKDHHQIISNNVFSLTDIPMYIDAVKHVNTIGINDRLQLLEKMIVIMSRLKNKTFADGIQKALMMLLFNDIPSPPASYMNVFDYKLEPLPVFFTGGSSGRSYVFRSADGSNYNLLAPHIGRAGSPYARSVPGVHPISQCILPEPELVFDTLLRRNEFRPHPGLMSSLFFGFANLVIHSCFYTNEDCSRNNTSSYLDLSILYGKSQEEQYSVRRRDGTGKLWNDVFADQRLLFVPPASAALLVLLSRNHNYIAQRLLEVNENDAYINPPPSDKGAQQLQDDELFHRARLVNCGYFVQIILRDYVGAILGLSRDGSDWRLDPLIAMRKLDHEIVTRGDGNQVSIEFNLLYRWHSTLSEKDTEWIEQLFQNAVKKDPSEINLQDFMKVKDVLKPHRDPRKREFGNLKRQADGRFKDEDLASIILDATERPAGAFCARGTPPVMRFVEILGMTTARKWGVCSLNEFRKFIGLKPYESFEEWNSDRSISKAAEALYKDIDNLELYVGLQAEETKEPEPGAGLCPGYTISRAILGDAVMLTRGDRFLTTEFTPHNLSAWGFNYCKYDPNDGSYGGLLTKLLLTMLPDYFPSRSAYVHFPFLVPSQFKTLLLERDRKLVEKYWWPRPSVRDATIHLNTHDTVNQALNDLTFGRLDDKRIVHIVKAEAEHNRLINGRISVEKLLPTAYPDGTLSDYFKEKIEELLTAKAFDICTEVRYVDIVKDVINLLPVHMIAEEIIGLPLKTDANTAGTLGEKECYQKFADIGNFVYINSEPANEWHLEDSAKKTYEEITGKYLKPRLRATGSKFVAALSDSHLGIAKRDAHQFIKRIRDANRDATVEELSTYIYATVVPTAALFSQAIVHVVDFYLDKPSERHDIANLAAKLDVKGSIEKIMHYIHAAIRANPLASGVYRTAERDMILGGVMLQAEQRVYVDLAALHTGTQNFGSDLKSKQLTPFGDPGLLSKGFFEAAAPTILGTIFALKDISRAGQSGKLARVPKDSKLPRVAYLDANGHLTPFPQSLLIQYHI